MICCSRRVAGLFCILATTLVLSACASSGSPPALFVLDGSQAPTASAHPPDAPTLMIAPVSVVPYLDQGGIVYQSAPYRVVIANNNRWAAPLPGALTDSLYSRLTAHLNGINLIRATTHHRDIYTLQTRVDEFGGHYDGRAHIAGQWSVVSPDGHSVLSHSFDRQIPLDQDGYAALVASLSKGWQQVADDMAPTLQNSVAAQGAD